MFNGWSAGRRPNCGFTLDSVYGLVVLEGARREASLPQEQITDSMHSLVVHRMPGGPFDHSFKFRGPHAQLLELG
jgi:hypothetical protein